MRSLVKSLPYGRISLPKALLWLLGSALLIWLCLGVGLGEWQRPDQIDPMIWELRWPRVLVALMVGMSLAVAGAAMQALFANPLADPSLIGTSSGAALGVVIVLAFGLGGLGVSLAAFLGAMTVCLVVLSVHHLLGSGRLGLLIIGFAISSFCLAIVSLILFVSDDMVLRSATNWLAGNLGAAGYTPIHYAATIMVLGLFLLISKSRDLDILLLGDETARSMGISVQRSRILIVVATAMLTGAAVSLSGVIGFIGMMVPNVIATVWGGTRASIMWRSAGIGALFLLLVDTIARHIVFPIDLPVGIVISLLGAPFFLWLFVKGMRT